jgi:L-ascorbate metabolism protein UlaG (beta-lactamase superfamily)
MTNRYYRGPRSDHFDGERFFNPHHPSTDRSLIDLLRWSFGGKREHWPAAVTSRQVVPKAKVDGLSVTMVGHATVLIQAAGQNLIVDPVWSERASPVGWAGPRRVTAPGIAFEKLPPISVVLLTHNHYDHLDMPTLDRLWDQHRPRVIAPLGNDAVIARKAPRIQAETHDWGQSVDLGSGFVVRLHPANHWSARGAGDRRMALWSGFIVETPAGSIYIAGDTGYGDGQIFRDVKMRCSPLDLAILPIGAYAPRWFMKDQHVDPTEAVQIMLDCGAAQALGVHWGTFPLTDESRMAPKNSLLLELAQRGLPDTSFIALEPGEVWSKKRELAQEN